MALKDILDQIKKEAEGEIAKLDKARDETIAAIQKEYAELREHKKAEMDKKVSENVGRIKDRAHTFAKMETRNNLLKAKRELLQNIFDDAVKQMTDADNYSDILVALLEKAAKAFDEGTVVPAKSKEDATKKALEKADTNFKLAGHSAKIHGGFILESGKVEVNFSFASILEKELWNDLEIELNKLLFP